MVAEMESPVELTFHTLCALSFLEATRPHKELQLSDRQGQKGVAEISNPMTLLSTVSYDVFSASSVFSLVCSPGEEG